MALALGEESDAIFIAEAAQPRIGHLQELSNGLVGHEAVRAEQFIETG
jgi:hypothetical protein